MSGLKVHVNAKPIASAIHVHYPTPLPTMPHVGQPVCGPCIGIVPERLALLATLAVSCALGSSLSLTAPAGGPWMAHEDHVLPSTCLLKPFPRQSVFSNGRSFLSPKKNKIKNTSRHSTSNPYGTLVARLILISTNFYKMITGDDEKAGNSVHDDQPAPSSSSSSKSGSNVDAQGGPQGVEQEEVPTIPVSAISIPTISAGDKIQAYQLNCS